MMRRFVLGVIALFTLALSPAMPLAQAQDTDSMVVEVPFEFRVGDETLPAGKYLVGRLSPSSTCFVIRSAEHGPSAAAMTAGTLQGDRKSGSRRLVFNVYGGVHFLSEVWAQFGSGAEVSKSHDERELAKAAAKAEPIAVLAIR